jgi:hypothetical protein
VAGGDGAARTARWSSASSARSSATNELEQFELEQFTCRRIVADCIAAILASRRQRSRRRVRRCLRRVEGACRTGLPGSIVSVSCRSVQIRLSCGFGARPSSSSRSAGLSVHPLRRARDAGRPQHRLMGIVAFRPGHSPRKASLISCGRRAIARR